MSLSEELRSRYATLDDDQLVEMRARTGLTMEAYDALDTLLAERRIAPEDVARTVAQHKADDAVLAAPNLEAAERHFGWLCVAAVAWVVGFGTMLLLEYQPLMVVLYLLALAAAFAQPLSAALTARDLKKSGLMWFILVFFLGTIGGVVAILYFGGTIKRLRTMSRKTRAAALNLK